MLFAKEKPGKKVPFEGGWVELQYLSKGIKDEYKSRLTELYSGINLDQKTMENLSNGNMENVPESTIKLVTKIQDIEYYKLAKAIKSWSATNIPINEDTVKELDETIFDQLVKEIDEMNELSQQARKN